MSNKPDRDQSEVNVPTKALADACVALLSEEFPGVRWDYSPGTLAELDKRVMDAWKTSPPGGDLERCADLLAAYVGEVQVRNLPGARWSMEEVVGADEHHEQLAVRVQSNGWDFVGYPFNWVCKRLANGDVDALAAKYEVSVQLTKPVTP